MMPDRENRRDDEVLPDISPSETVTKADISDIMAKFDRESAFRTLTGYRGVIISAVLILFSAIQLASTWWIIPSTHMRPLHLCFVMTLAYLLYPARKGGRKGGSSQSAAQRSAAAKKGWETRRRRGSA